MSQQSYTRSKGQVLHRFEPGSVATIPLGTIEISRHYARKVDDLGRDLQDAVRQELTRWKHLDAQMDAFFRKYTAECVFVTTQAVHGRRLEVRECAKCGAIRYMRQWRGEPDASCHRCSHPTLNEIPFVFAHADGTMVQLTPRDCPRHGLDYLVLERWYQKRWRCKVECCNHAETIVLSLSKNSLMKREEIAKDLLERTGKAPNQKMTLTTVSDKKLQVVHSISRINSTSNLEKFLTYSESFPTLLVIYLEPG